jgi:hypothetical protein
LIGAQQMRADPPGPRIDGMIRLGACILLLIVALPAATQTIVYQCTDTRGQVTYQGTRCDTAQRQQIMLFSDTQPVAPAASAPATVAPDVADTPPIARPPRTPPAPMYLCTNAVNGQTYTNANGNPQPYLAPLGMTGILPSSLGQTYSGANTGKANANLIANHYTWVQDACQPMTPEDTCRALRDDYDANEQKLSRAFQSQQAPLLQREADLRAQLTHC